MVSSSKSASLEEGNDIGTLTRFWTVRRKAVLRPEKEKSRELASGWGKVKRWESPDLARWEIAGPPG